MSNIAYRIGGRNFRRLGLAAVTIFEISRIEAPIPDDDPMRDAHELGIRELDPRSGIAIVEQDIDAGVLELPIQRIGRFPGPAPTSGS